ncbi:MAG: hypothetical protein DI629_17540 [Mesorhizobium amorphae]|nr:MAG: hypothetical protein DI629_17540 [Mesorhizobium amorphae]
MAHFALADDPADDVISRSGMPLRMVIRPVALSGETAAGAIIRMRRAQGPHGSVLTAPSPDGSHRVALAMTRDVDEAVDDPVRVLRALVTMAVAADSAGGGLIILPGDEVYSRVAVTALRDAPNVTFMLADGREPPAQRERSRPVLAICAPRGEADQDLAQVETAALSARARVISVADEKLTPRSVIVPSRVGATGDSIIGVPRGPALIGALRALDEAAVPEKVFSSVANRGPSGGGDKWFATIRAASCAIGGDAADVADVIVLDPSLPGADAIRALGRAAGARVLSRDPLLARSVGAIVADAAASRAPVTWRKIRAPAAESAPAP